MRALSFLPLLAITAATALAAPLAACSTQGERDMVSYTAAVERQRTACEARGGTLQPTGKVTGNAAADHPCRIGQATATPQP